MFNSLELNIYRAVYKANFAPILGATQTRLCNLPAVFSCHFTRQFHGALIAIVNCRPEAEAERVRTWIRGFPFTVCSFFAYIACPQSTPMTSKSQSNRHHKYQWFSQAN